MITKKRMIELALQGTKLLIEMYCKKVAEGIFTGDTAAEEISRLYTEKEELREEYVRICKSEEKDG